MNIERVMTEYQSALRAFLLSRVGTSADSDDLVQEVLIKTFQNLHTLEDPAKLKPWLFRIAQNVLMDHYRRKARGAGLTAEDLWHAEDSEEAHAFEGCVEPFLKVLPDEAAALLRAVDLDGRPQKDYAAQLGISYSTLKSRVQSARRQLKALLEECCDVVLSADGNVIDYERKPGTGDCC